MKKKFTFLMAALMLLTIIGLPGNAVGQKSTSTYTISLKDSGSDSDSNTAISGYISGATVSNFVSISGESGYVSTISSSYIFQASTNNGWKLSSGKGYGTFALNLSSDAQSLTVSKVTINAKNYGSDATTLTVTITKGDNTEQSQSFSSLDSNFTDYDLTLTTASTIKTIRVAANAKSKRAYVHHITVTYSTGTDTYDVTYKANEGAGNDFVDNNGGDGYANGASVTVKANEGAGNPNFSRTGYTFSNWNTQANGSGTPYSAGNTFPISSNTNLFAQWTKNNYNVAVSSINDVTLTATYGAGANTIEEGNNANVPYGTAITLASTDLGEGQAFLWSITKAYGGDDVTGEVLDGTTLTVPDYDITIGGTVVSTCTVTYNCNGSTSDCPENVSDIASGSSITLAAAPTKTGCVFAGWRDDTNTYDAGDPYTVTEDVTFTAQWMTGGTITFNKNAVTIDDSPIYGDDSAGNEWTITTVGTTSYTNTSNEYSQVGSSSAPATSITFTTTLPVQANITAFSAKFGGFSGTAGTITLKVGETTIGSGSLNAGNDVIVENSSSAVGTVLTVTVTSIARGVKCYYISYSYPTGSDPIISAPNSINLSSTDTNKEFTFEIVNPVSGKTLSAATSTSWISNVTVDNTNNKVTLTTDENETTSDRSGSITLSYEGATDKVVTINQSKKDYAAMPFAYDGNGLSDLPTGFTQNGLTDSYASSPKMKFDGTGDYAVLKLHEAPTSISYDIKGSNANWYGTFKVQTSADGITYNDLDTYNNGDLTNVTYTITHIDLPSTVRYIRWIFDAKSPGYNVGVGNIKASTSYDIYGIATTTNFTPTSLKKCTIYNGSKLTVSGTLTNTIAANLIIEDGGQLVTTSAVQATFKKNIEASVTTGTPASHWYTIASPVGEVDFGTISNFQPEDGGNNLYDIYLYNEPAMRWDNSVAAGFSAFENCRGYIYRKTDSNTLSFTGTINVADSYNNQTVTASASVVALKGFNLLGNPYSHNINLKHVTVTAGANLDACYILSGDGGWQSELENTADIKPCTGFLVQATAESKVTIHKTEQRSKANSDYIKFIVANSQYEDVAYALFDEGHGLNKIDHRNSDIPKVYIIKDGEEFAVATMADNTNAFNLNFDAKTAGRYTLSYKTGGEFNYLHVIDRMTGEDVDMLLAGEYSFIGSPQDSKDRFIVRLGYLPNYADNGEDIFVYQSGNDIIASGEGELQIFDVTGRKVTTQRINGVETVSGLENGVYVFRLIGNEIKTQKIVVR